jgi:AcrR family transcriptional regulator
MPKQKKKTRRVSKAQWLDMALEVLETDGIAGVRIEILAKRLEISKSGFYWHFKNRDHLLKDVLDYWSHELTKVVTENPQLLSLKPKSRLIKTAEMILEHDLTRYEIPIRQWALQDAVAARAVRKVNRLRLDFIGDFIGGAFSELGFTGDDLDMRTMLFTCYHTWEAPMFREISRKRRRELIAKRIGLLTSN